MRIPFLAFALTVSLGTAQTPHCNGANDTSLTISNAITTASFFGPNQFAMQFSPTQPQIAYGAQVATANTFQTNATMGVELWSENTSSGLPLARLAGGSWAIDPNRAIAWQGANFDLPVPLTAGSNYWLVFIEPGFSTPNLEPAGTPVNCARWDYMTNSWSPILREAKFRVLCSFMDGNAVAVNGAPCTSSMGRIGTAFTNEAPSLGNGAFTIEGSGLPDAALTFLVVGFTPGFPSIPLVGFPNGCEQSTLVVDTIGTGTTAPGLGGPGHVQLAVPIPGAAGLVGLVAGFQLATIDSGANARIPIVTTNSVYITLF